MGDEEEAPRKGVGRLAKFFESQIPTSDTLSTDRSHNSHNILPGSNASNRRVSTVGRFTNSSVPKRTSIYERPGVSPPNERLIGGWPNGPLHSSTPVLNAGMGSPETVFARSNGDFRHGGGSTVVPRPRREDNEQADDSESEKKRISVSRLSQFFENAIDLHMPYPPTSGGPGVISRNTTYVGMPKSGSTGNLHEHHSRPLGNKPPPPLRQQRLGASASAEHLPNHARPGSGADGYINPFLADEERSLETLLSSDNIEVPKTVPVSQRIASIAAVMSAAHSARPSSIYTPPRSPLSESSMTSRSNTSPSTRTFSPVPPPSLPSSPAFKRARPPVVPSPAALGMRDFSSTPSLSFGEHTDAAHKSRPPSTIIVMPDPRSTHLPNQSHHDTSIYDAPVAQPPNRAHSSQALLSVSEERSRTPSPLPGGSRGEAKRDHVVREIISTEKGFLKDMEVLMEVYALPASHAQVLSQQDLKHLFSNLDVIITTSRALLELLEAAAGAPDQWIGEAFNQMMRKIETTYCEYCKHNEAAMTKLAEFASPECPPQIKDFLKDCQMKLQGRTGAWDLGSLVIKPVQRVLKYPLLIKQLLKETPPEHPDFEQLCKAAEDIELVAEKINEVKKRKDLVEKYVDGKGNVNVIHGITKKWTRGTQQLKKATGLAEPVTTSDALYDALVDKLDQQFRGVQQLSIDLVQWLAKVKQLFDLQETIATAFEDVYVMERSASSLEGGDDFFPIQEYQKACVRHTIETWRDAEDQIKTVIQPALDTLLKKFKDPQTVMRKREKKLLDYERAMAIKARGEQVDKTLNDSAEAYGSLHGQLVEELPQFLDLVAKYIDVVAVYIADLQAQVHASIVSELKPILELTGGANEDIIGSYLGAMESGGRVDVISRNVNLLARWRGDIWGPEAAVRKSQDENGWETIPRPRANTIATPASIESEMQRGFATNPQSRSSPNVFRGGSLGRMAGENGPSILGNTEDSPHRNTFLGSSITPLTPSPYAFSSGASPLPLEPSSTAAFSVPDITHDPAPPPTPDTAPEFDAVALYDFEADLPEEVHLKAGDRIVVYDADGRGGDWWFGFVNGKEGWFPGSYVSRVEK
ncbi:hypothetical protein SpCBS45565_g03710 [Spizellomyces sp. 'palustris']|nr:hypothetical protein SpCBS45565_g03710 [Spizellomyces sp. 'palustris']